MSDPTTRLGRFELVTLLGQSPVALVWLALARGPALSKLVVVKQLRPELAGDEQLAALFIDEARVAARVNHPNVATTYEVVEEAGHLLVVMEPLEGHTLAEVQERVGRLPFDEHLWILTQVLAGLHCGHELCDADGEPLGLVHREVSTATVLVTHHGEVKLLDFGVGRTTGALAARRQAVGAPAGRLGHAAPEQLLGGKTDARTDVFAVGIMLAEAAAGQTALGEVVARATAPDPRARFGTAAELQQALEQHLETRPRPVGRHEVAALVSRAFHADRARVRHSIEALLGGARPTMPIDDPPSLSPASPSTEPAMPAMRPPGTGRFVAATVIAAAGMMGVLVGLVRGPATPALRPDSTGGPPVHSVLLDPAEPPRTPPPPERAVAAAAPAPHQPALADAHAARKHPALARRRTHALAGKSAPPSRTVELGRPTEPGMDLRAPQAAEQRRTIDEKDPYAR